MDIGIYDVFVIWCLEFVFLDTKLLGRSDWVPNLRISGQACPRGPDFNVRLHGERLYAFSFNEILEV